MKEKTSSKNSRSWAPYGGDEPVGWLIILLVSLVALIWAADVAVAAQLF